MTATQYALCQLLYRCRYLPGSFQKRFARTVQGYTQDRELTARQAAYLLQQAHNYRRQLHALIGTDIPCIEMQRRLRLTCELGRLEYIGDGPRSRI